LERIERLGSDDNAPESAIALVGKMKILIPMAGLIDKHAELARLEKELQRIQQERSRIEGKLNNAAFVDKAPAEVIEKERSKLADLLSSQNDLQQQYDKISAL
jgi:valyl-tRNA synthetase